MKKSIAKRLCTGIMIFAMLATSVCELFPTKEFISFGEIETVYAAVTAPGGEVILNSAKAATSATAAKTALGASNVTAAYSSSTKTLEITLNADITLTEPLVLTGAVAEYDTTIYKVTLNLNGHTLSGAAGQVTTDYEKAFGNDAILINDPIILTINGSGSVVGGEGGTYLGVAAEDGPNQGMAGGYAINLLGIPLSDEYDHYFPDTLKHGIIIDNNASIIGGKGGDITYEQWIENLDYSADLAGVDYDKYWDANAGIGGIAIGAVEDVGSGYGAIPCLSFGYVKLNSGSILGGAGGNVVVGSNSTERTTILARASSQKYKSKTRNFYFSHIEFNGGGGGAGIVTRTGRRYIYTAAGTTISGGNGGQVTATNASKMANRVTWNHGVGGDGILIGGDIGYTSAEVDETTITKSQIAVKDGRYTGIYIAGTVKGGDSPANTARYGNTRYGGTGIGSLKADYANVQVAGCFDDYNLGAIYVASTGYVKGGNAGDVFWGTARKISANWYYHSAGMGIQSTWLYGRDYNAPRVYVIDGIAEGGNGGNSRGGRGGMEGNVTSNGIVLANILNGSYAFEGEYGEGQCAIGLPDMDGLVVMGSGTLKAGTTGTTYKSYKMAYPTTPSQYNTTEALYSERDVDTSKFTGTIKSIDYTDISQYKNLSTTGTVTVSGTAVAKNGQAFTCTVQSSSGTGTPYYDWRYTNGTTYYGGELNGKTEEFDLQGKGTNSVSIVNEISQDMNYAIQNKNDVYVLCYVVYPNGVTLKSNLLKLTQGETITPCKITFNANGGQCTNTAYATMQLAPNETYYLGNLNSYFKRRDFDLVGWNTKADGSGTQYRTFDTISYKSSNYTLYAQWKGQPYGIHFDVNGGNPLSEEETDKIVYEASTMGAMPTPTHSDLSKSFLGWYSKRVGGKKITSSYVVSSELYDIDIFEETNYDYTGATVLYAHWGTTYPITYVLNGGTNHADNSSKYTDQEATTLYNPTRTGYTFGGWYTAADFSGTKVTSIPKGTTGAKTFYAKWTPITYTVAFFGNGNTSGTVESQSFTYDVAQSLRATGFVRTGYDLTGWNTKADGSGTAYGLGESVINLRNTAGTVNLYAVWTAKTMTVSFDSNGGEALVGGDASKTITYDQTYGELPTPVSSNENYEFAGWFTEAVGGVEIKPTTLVNKLSNHTLYAHWGIRYTITYVLNGGPNHADNVDHFYDCDQVNLYAPTRAGYIFGGWYKNSLTGEKLTTIPAGTEEDITVCAKWTPITYSIVFKVNGTGFTGTMSSLTNRKYGTSYTLPAVAYKKTGYTFVGWNTKADGTGTTYKNKASVKNLTTTNGKTVYLYAKWTKTKYAITYKLNGGVNGKNPAFYYITTATFTLKNPTRTGYTFKGWYTDSKFKKKFTSIKKGSHAAVTVYAKWQVNKYNITFDKNGATSGSMKKLTGRKYGTTYTLPANSFKRKGYTFLGWATSLTNAKNYKVAYKNKVKVKNLTAKNGATVKLYAVWVKNTQKFTISYVTGAGVTNKNPKTFTYLTATITLKNPTKAGYRFLGWYTSTAYTKKVTSIPKGSVGNKILVARWEKIVEVPAE